MKCPKCKKKIEDGQKFCGYCGAAIPEKKHKKMDKKFWVPASVTGVCVVAILGAVLLTNPQQTSAGKLEKKIEAGNRYLEEADYEKAEVAFNEALSIDEKSPEAALGLAKVCNEKKDPESALNYLKLANENLGSMSKKQIEEQKIDWAKKTEDYQKTFDTTSQLFLASGNEKRAEFVNEEKEKAEQNLVIIIKVVNEEIEMPEDDSKSVVDMTAEVKELVGKAEGAEPTGTPEPTEEPEPTETPEPTEEPEPTETPEPTEEPEPTETPEPTEEAEPTEEPEPTEISEPTEETAVMSPEESLYDYAQKNILSVEPLLNSQTVGYDFSSGNISALNGTIAYQVEDLDGDGNPELLVVNVSNGQMGFDIFRSEDSTVAFVGHVNAYYNCLGAIAQDYSFGMTQLCFLKDNGGSFDIGLASHRNGNDAEEKSGDVQTTVELYSLNNDEIVMKNAVSIKNGKYVLLGSNGDLANESGKEVFVNELNAIGMDGNWISESADTLMNMDLTGNPAQDVSGVPDPLKNGMAAIENGVQDVAYLNGLMNADSGSISLNILEHPSSEQCAENYQYNEDSGGVSTSEDEAEETLENVEDTSSEQSEENGEDISIEENTEGGTDDSVENETGVNEEGYVEDLAGDSEEYGIPVATEDGTYVTENEDNETEEVSDSSEDIIIYEDENIPEESVESQENPVSTEESSDAEENVNYEENSEQSAVTESTEDAVASPDELLDTYASENIWPNYAKIQSQAFGYDYGSGTVQGADGILGAQKQDLDGDGMPELLVIRFQSGQIVWDIYRVNNSVVELVSTTIPKCNSLGTALQDFNYEMSQVCFLKDNGGSFSIGIASNYRNIEAGEGTPSVRTSVELYNIYSGSCELVNAVTILNGVYVYCNNDRGSAIEGGSDSFISYVSSMGLSGSWITQSTDALNSMDIINNPGQDTSAVPDPLENGISSQEGQGQDLVIMCGNMGSGSGSMNITVQNNANLY